MLLIGGLAAAAGWSRTPAARADVPAVPQETGATVPLPKPAVLRPQVEFWKKIFGVYSEDQVVIHDAEDLRRVYSVLDFRPLRAQGLADDEIEEQRRIAVEREKGRVAELLRRLRAAGNPDPLGEEGRKIGRLFGPKPNSEELLAAARPDRIRAQRGLRERFQAGISISRRYLPEIERIFREHGVPVALTRLALVESCFDTNAYSKAGAAGVWQFIPSTGRLFLRIDETVDERRDPVLSARAAAQFLRQNYEKLGTWPLAVTAYNHGPGGVARAVSVLGTTDIGAILTRYRGPAFGFASRNFYPELLAALEIDARYVEYFGPIELAEPAPTEWVAFAHYLPLRTIARLARVELEELIDLNPAFSEEVRQGKLYVAKGYPVRVPAGHAQQALARFASLSPTERFLRQRTLYVMHRVRKGQTLSHIARHYGTTVRRIQAANRLRGTVVRVGQSLKIPTG